MIRGGIDNVIKWLLNNDIEYWTISASRNKSDNQIVFAHGEDDGPRDADFERMKETLALCENNVLYLQGRKTGQKGYVGLYMETFVNKPEQERTAAIAGVPEARAGIDPDNVNDLINRAVENAIEKQQMEWQRQDLERREKELREQRREFEANQRTVWGQAVKMAGPFLQQVASAFVPRQGANVAIGTVPGEHTPILPQQPQPQLVQQPEQQQPEQQPEQQQPEQQQPEPADAAGALEDELNEALNRYADFDPDDYATVLIKLCNAICSGQDIKLMGGMVTVGYDTFKQQILSL